MYHIIAVTETVWLTDRLRQHCGGPPHVTIVPPPNRLWVIKGAINIFTHRVSILGEYISSVYYTNTTKSHSPRKYVRARSHWRLRTLGGLLLLMIWGCMWWICQQYVGVSTLSASVSDNNPEQLPTDKNMSRFSVCKESVRCTPAPMGPGLETTVLS